MSSIDTALFVEGVSHEAESVHMVDDVAVSLGGKGLIAAIAMSHEGVNIAPLALVGHDSLIVASLPDAFNTDWLVPAQTEDSRIWLTVGGGQRVAAFVARGHCSLADAELEALGAKYSASVEALYLSFEAVPLLRGAFAEATSDQIPVAVNLSRPLIDTMATEDRNFLRELVARADLIMCNVDESKRVLQALTASTWVDVLGRNASMVVTDGAAGGAIYTPSGSGWTRYEPVEASSVKSVVGAGDTFNGALLAAHWTQGLSIVESSEPAAALASACLHLASSSILGTLPELGD